MGSAIGVNLNSILFQMNKIYSSQIEKANSLAGGIEKNAAKLKASNVSVDLQKLKECTLQLAELAEKQDAAEAALAQARGKAHEKLNELKNIYEAVKFPIKSHFAMEQWPVFGIADKR